MCVTGILLIMHLPERRTAHAEEYRRNHQSGLHVFLLAIRPGKVSRAVNGCTVRINIRLSPRIGHNEPDAGRQAPG